MNILRIFLVFILLNSLVGIVLAKNDYYLPENTKLVLPSSPEINVNWILPFNVKLNKKWGKNFRFDIDKKGIPWFGYAKKILTNPLEQLAIETDQHYIDFAWLDTGELAMCTDTALGYLSNKPLTRKDNALPMLQFKPVLSLPYKNFRLFPGKGNTLYLLGRNPRSRNYEIYVLQEKKGKGIIKKLFATEKKISAIAGDGEQTYIAAGRLIVKLIPEKNDMESIFLHPKERITGLDYSPKSGLFYTTESAIGFVSDDNRFEFMKSPDTQIRIRDKSLYILLGETYGVLKIDGINKFKNLKDKYGETALMSAESSGHTDTAEALIDAGNDSYYEKGILAVGFKKGVSQAIAEEILKSLNLKYRRTKNLNMGKRFFYKTGEKFLVRVPDGEELIWLEKLNKIPEIEATGLSVDPRKALID